MAKQGDYTVVLFRSRFGWEKNDNFNFGVKSNLYDLGGNYRVLYPDGTLGPPSSGIGLCWGEGVVLMRAAAPEPCYPRSCRRYALGKPCRQPSWIQRDQRRVGSQVTNFSPVANLNHATTTAALLTRKKVANWMGRILASGRTNQPTSPVT